MKLYVVFKFITLMFILLGLASCGNKDDFFIDAKGDLPKIILPPSDINLFDSAPVTADINFANLPLNTTKVVHLDYVDIDNDIAAKCSVIELNKLSIVSDCVCDSKGECSVSILPDLDYIGSGSFKFSVSAKQAQSNISNASLDFKDITPPTIVNHAPMLANISNQSLIENTPLMKVDANDVNTGNDTDRDGQVLIYSCQFDQVISNSIINGNNCNDLPGVANFNAQTGILNWTPNFQSADNPHFEVEIIASDGLISDKEVFLISVIDYDHPPVTKNLSLVDMLINTEKIISLEYSDADNDLANTCIISGLNNLTISSACSCDLSGLCKVGVTAALGYYGPASFNYSVKTKNLISNVSEVPLKIEDNTPVNHAPLLVMIADQTINENDPITQIDARDSNSGNDLDIDGDSISYSCHFDNIVSDSIQNGKNCSQLPGSIIFDSTTGILNWVPNYSAADTPIFEIEILGSDGFLTDNEIFIINVNNVVNDHAPITTAIIVTDMKIDIEKIIELPYTDAEKDLANACSVTNLQQVVISKVCTCDNAGVCSVGVTGLNNFYGDASFNFNLTAKTLVSNTSSATLTINDNPPVNRAPKLAEILDQTVLTNSPITQIDANDINSGNDKDIDGDSIDYSCRFDNATSASIINGKNCAHLPGSIAFNSTTGILNWTPNELAADTPIFEIEILGSDRSLADNEIFIINVNKVIIDQAPVTTDITIADMTINIEKIIELPYTDVENDLASTCSVIDLQQVVISKACACDNAGVCSVGVTGVNNFYGDASFNFHLTAKTLVSNTSRASLTINDNTPVNRAPKLAEILDQSVYTNSPIAQIDANDINNGNDKDIDGDNITYSCRFDNISSNSIVDGKDCAQLPGSATFDTAAGILNWTPSDLAADTPIFEFEILGSDGFLADNEIFIININNDHAPITTAISFTDLKINTEKIIELPYTDVENDLANTCSVTALTQVVVSKVCACDAAGICSVGITGVNNYYGDASFNFSVTAKSLISNVSNATLVIKQDEPVNRAPDLAQIPGQTIFSASSIAQIDANDINADNDKDIDGDTITYSCLFDNIESGSIETGDNCDNLPGTAVFEVSTGVLNWTASSDADSTPIYEIEIIGSDGSLTDNEIFIITVNKAIVDSAPITVPFSLADLKMNTEKIINLAYTDANNDLASACEVTSLLNVVVTSNCSCDAAGVCSVGVTGISDYYGSASLYFSVTANTKQSNLSLASLTVIDTNVYNNQVDTFYQNVAQASKVDILWVIDDSGSMGGEQAALATNFSHFINNFVTNDIDFTMGITTTDATYYKNGYKVGDFNNLTSVAYKNDSNKFINDFKNYINVGTGGSGNEKGLETSKKFFSRYPQFLRDDATLIIIYVSDENDHSSYNSEHYYNNFLSLKNSKKDQLKIFNIVRTQVCDRYMDLANLSNGVIADIANDFHTTLKDMGKTIVSLLESFTLAKSPSNPDDILVFVDDIKMTLDTDYTYDSAMNTIRFIGVAVPTEGQKIEIKYLTL